MSGPLLVHPSAFLADLTPGFEPAPSGFSPEVMAEIYGLLVEVVIGLAVIGVVLAVHAWLVSRALRRAEAAGGAG